MDVLSRSWFSPMISTTSGGGSLLGRSRSSDGRCGAGEQDGADCRPSRRRWNPTVLPRPPERRAAVGAAGTNEEMNKEVFWSSAFACGFKAKVGGARDPGKTEDGARANNRRDRTGKSCGLSKRVGARKSVKGQVRASPRRPAQRISPHQSGRTRDCPDTTLGTGIRLCRIEDSARWPCRSNIPLH